jgi:cell division protein FtsA
MKLPFVGKKNEDEDEQEIYLALDIGTAYVKAMVFVIEDGQIHAKGYAKSKQQSNAMRGAMIVNIKKVISACDLAIGEALNMADKILGKEKQEENYETPTPDRVVLGVAGEFVKGVAIMANYEREDSEEKITNDETADVIDSVKEQAFEGVLEDISDEIGVEKENIVEINSVINSTYIDGIRVEDPEGFTGKDVAFRVFTSFAPSLHINSLIQVVEELGLNLHSIEVEPYAIAKALNSSKKDNFSGIIIDIGGGTTDIALVDGGGIIGTKMIGFGGEVFTRRVEKSMNVDYKEAEEMKLDYSDMKLSQTKTKKLKKIFRDDVKTWVKGVEIALDDFEDVKKYPSKIYLCGGGSSLIDIKEGLIEYPWLNRLPFHKFPKSEYIFPNQMNDFVDDTKKIINPDDIAAVSLALSVIN